MESVSDGNVTVASAAASYHPAFYWVIGTAALPFDGAASLYAMRIATALLSLLFIGLAAWSASRVGSVAPGGLVLAPTPVFVYSTTVAPNGVEMSAGLALWGPSWLSSTPDARSPSRLLWHRDPRAMALGTLRALGPLFILMIVATVAMLDWGALEISCSPTANCAGRLCAVGASVLGQALRMFDTVAAELARSDRPPPSAPGGLIDLEQHHRLAAQTVAAFPFRDHPGAPIIYPIVVTLVVAMTFGGLSAMRRQLRGS